MDSLNRIFTCINEAKKKHGKGKSMIPKHHEKKGGEKSPLGKANPYDHDHKMEEAKKLSPKQKKIAGIAGDPNAIDAADLAALRAGKKKKVNASTEVVHILGIIKEAYEDELISEEAFLALADPIIRSLQEMHYSGTPTQGKITAGRKGRTKTVSGKKAAGIYTAAKRRVTKEFGSEEATPPKGAELHYSKK